jgi:hypothetical protein
MGRVGLYDGEIADGAIVHAALRAIADEVGAANFLTDRLIATFPDTLAADRVAYDSIELDYQTRADGIAVRSLIMKSPHLILRAEGLIATDDTVAGWGVITFSEELTRELIASLGPLIRLAGTDGKLRVPVRLRGAVANASVTVDERFTDELGRAMRGERVGPFAATEPESELVMDLPTLRDQFNRR